MTKDKIYQLIEENRLNEAVVNLKDLVVETSQELYNCLSLINGRVNQLKRDCALGITSTEIVDIKQNQIRKSLIELTEQCFSELSQKEMSLESKIDPVKYTIFRRSQRKYTTRQLIESAKETIFLLSEIPTTFFSSNLSDVVKKKLSEGVKIKIIMLNPNQVSIEHIKKTNNHYSDDSVVGFIKTDMERQIEEYKRISKLSQNRSLIEMRLWEGKITTGLLITDHGLVEKAICRAELRLYKTTAEERPNIYFRPSSIHYHTFVEQFSKIWNESAIIPLANKS